MLDATGVVVRVHYKSMKCDVLFSHGSIRTLFRRDRVKFSSSLKQCNIIKIDRDFA